MSRNLINIVQTTALVVLTVCVMCLNMFELDEGELGNNDA